jgi:hypothetical protein
MEPIDRDERSSPIINSSLAFASIDPMDAQASAIIEVGFQTQARLHLAVYSLSGLKLNSVPIRWSTQSQKAGH